MNLYTIGFTQKTAEQFFELIKKNNVNLLLDIRLNNSSQLAGFAKGNDIPYFLREICQCKYEHCLEFAPTKELLDGYKDKKITWDEYEQQYYLIISERKSLQNFVERFEKYKNICLLCSEPKADMCHRRLLAEMITKDRSGIIYKHI